MKTAHWILIIVIFYQVSLFAQTTSDSVYAYNCIKVYPLNYFSSQEYNIGYERVINSKSSFEMILSYNYGDYLRLPNRFENLKSSFYYMIPAFYLAENALPELKSATGGSLRLGYRIYSRKHKKTPCGGFINPQIMYKYTVFDNIRAGFEYQVDYLDIYQHGITLKFLAGYQIAVKKIAISYFAGFGLRYQIQKVKRYAYSKYDDETMDWNDYQDNSTKTITYLYQTLHAGVSIGYFF